MSNEEKLLKAATVALGERESSQVPADELLEQAGQKTKINVDAMCKIYAGKMADVLLSDLEIMSRQRRRRSKRETRWWNREDTIVEGDNEQ